MTTEEFVTMKAGPDDALPLARRLQSNADPIAPLMTKYGTPLIVTLDSLNTAAAREMILALRD